MAKHYQNFRLDEQTNADILAMAEHVAGKPGNLTAGFYALVAEWRRLKAEHEARLHHNASVTAWEEHLDALDRREEAEGR